MLKRLHNARSRTDEVLGAIDRPERGGIQISCESMERVLSDRRRGGVASPLAPSEESHLAQCAACRRDAEEGSALFAAIPALEADASESAPLDFGSRALFTRTVLASIQDEPIPVRRKERALARPLRWGAVAATALLAFAILTTHPSESGDDLAGSAPSLETLFEQFQGSDARALWEERAAVEDSFGGDYMLCEFIPPSGDAAFGIDSLTEMKF